MQQLENGTVYKEGGETEQLRSHTEGKNLVQKSHGEQILEKSCLDIHNNNKRGVGKDHQKIRILVDGLENEFVSIYHKNEVKVYY